MNKSGLSMGVFLAGVAAQAAGMVTVVGKLTGLSQGTFQVETKTSIYTVKKSAVSPGQAAQLDRSEDNEVALTVPFEGIVSVKPKDKLAAK